jgi:WXG100 family type VII secretion target
MVEIRVNPDQVDNTGKQFATKRGELEALISQANSLMNSLQGAFTGSRASAIFAEWNSMQANLKNSVQTLQQASDLLKRAATDFRSADSAR